MKNNQSLKTLSLAALGYFALSGQVFAEEPKCEIDRPVVFAGLDWDSAAFHNKVASIILEAGYGCETDSIPGSTIPLFNGMVKGDIDVTMEVWRENIVEPWKKALENKEVIDLGSNFPDAVQAWYVPKYLVEGDDAPAKGLKSVKDLAKFKELFKDPEEPSKGRFLNCIAGWGCEAANSKKLTIYGLDEHFVNFRPGTGAAMNSAIESRLKRKKPIVFYYWSPTWVIGKYGDQIVALEEPEYNKEIWDKMNNSENPTEATAYPLADIRVGVNAEFFEQAPKLVEFFKNYETNSKLVSEALNYMQENKADTDETAEHFLKNQEDVWTKWVSEDVANRVKASLK